MTSDQRMDLNISNCPKCGTRLMCGKIIVTGYHQCPKCRRHWVIEMERNKVTVNCTPFVRQYGILFRKWGVFI